MHRSYLENAALATPREVPLAPADVRLAAGQPAMLGLIKTEGKMLHNFRLNAGGQAGEIDVGVSAAASVEARLNPTAAGKYTFCCDTKLRLIESHREKGMEGRLIVTAG